MICIWQLDIVGPLTDRVRFFSQGWCDRDVAPRVPSAIVAPSKPGKHMQLNPMNQPETVVRHSPEFSRSGDTDIVSDPAARSTVAAHGVLDMSKTPRVEKVMTCQCHWTHHMPFEYFEDVPRKVAWLRITSQRCRLLTIPNPSAACEVIHKMWLQ